MPRQLEILTRIRRNFRQRGFLTVTEKSSLSTQMDSILSRVEAMDFVLRNKETMEKNPELLKKAENTYNAVKEYIETGKITQLGMIFDVGDIDG